MTRTQRFSLASLVAIPALLLFMSFTLIASADTGTQNGWLHVQVHSTTWVQDWDTKPMQTKWESCKMWDGLRDTYNWRTTILYDRDWNWWNEKCKDWNTWQQHGYGSQDNSSGYDYATALSPGNEVPSVQKQAHGDAKVQFTGSHGNNMSYVVHVTNPGDPVTEGHLHCAPAGVNGPVVVGIFSFPQGQEMHNYTIDGSITGNMIAGTGKDCKGTIGYEITSMDDLVRAIKEGKIYVNVHSKAYPNGVMRGQLGSGYTNPSYGGYSDGSSYDYNKDKDWNKDAHTYMKYSEPTNKHEWKGEDWKDHDWANCDDQEHWTHHDSSWNNKDEWKDNDHKDKWNKDNHSDDWNKENRDWNKDDHDSWDKDWSNNNDWEKDSHDWDNKDKDWDRSHSNNW